MGADHVRLFEGIHAHSRGVAALPVESAVLDDEAIVMRSADRCDFEALRSREGQAEAILVAYDIMEVGGQDVRPEPREQRRKRLARLLSRSNKALSDGIHLSEAITGDGATIFRHACGMDLERLTSLGSLAKALIARGIPTARGGKQWSAMQVRRVIERRFQALGPAKVFDPAQAQ